MAFFFAAGFRFVVERLLGGARRFLDVWARARFAAAARFVAALFFAAVLFLASAARFSAASFFSASRFAAARFRDVSLLTLAIARTAIASNSSRSFVLVIRCTIRFPIPFFAVEHSPQLQKCDRLRWCQYLLQFRHLVHRQFGHYRP